MDKNERVSFIKITEKLVTPAKVASIFGGAQFLSKLPQFMQKKIMNDGAKKDPYISFIVEPYSLFLAYEIIDEKQVKGMLSDDYELVECSMFADTTGKKCVIIGAFNVHTSVFWGNRLEVYLIAKNKRTGFVSWIIQEYETNTISYDPGRGFVMPDVEHALLTTSCLGEVVLEVVSKEAKNRIKAIANVKNGEWRSLNEQLWVEGNLSIDYSSELTDLKTKPFGLVFDPAEMDQALQIKEKDFNVSDNTFLDGIIAKVPFEVCCFPYAQHFYTTNIPMGHSIKNKTDLENRIYEINRTDGKTLAQETTVCSAYCYSYACKDGCRLKDKK
jgi:hypothetical protein